MLSGMPTGRQPTAHPRPTLRDVAERAGVAASTASLAFSERGSVAPATVRRVREAAAELGYLGPDPLAASLRQGRSGIVGAFAESRLAYAFRDPCAAAMLEGLSQVLYEMQAGLLLIHDPGDGPLRAAAQPMDAAVFLFCGEETNPLVAGLEARGVPIIGTGAPLGESVRHVRIDERGASARITRLLLELGHRPDRLAHLMMPLTRHSPTELTTLTGAAESAYPDTRERALGFADVAGWDVPAAQTSESDVEQGRLAAGLLLDADQPPTAIVAQSDLLAVGAIQAATDRGLRVPEDLSVTGFDGVALPWFPHRLTTIDQHAVAKGRATGEMLRAVLNGESPPDRMLPVDLRIGDTTAAPAGAA